MRDALQQYGALSSMRESPSAKSDRTKRAARRQSKGAASARPRHGAILHRCHPDSIKDEPRHTLKRPWSSGYAPEWNPTRVVVMPWVPIFLTATT
jgi:hypothetical protein